MVSAAACAAGAGIDPVSRVTRTLIDHILPTWHYNEVHTTVVAALPSRVFLAFTEITPRETPLFRVLMALRAIPARLAGGRVSQFSLDRPLLDQFLDAGFAILGVDPDREVVVGTISRFWELRGGTRAPFRGPEDFTTFDTSGFAKAALDVLIEERDRGTLLRTETRVVATDEASRLAFGRYWALIRPGSGAIRREWLAATKRRAESEG